MIAVLGLGALAIMAQFAHKNTHHFAELAGLGTGFLAVGAGFALLAFTLIVSGKKEDIDIHQDILTAGLVILAFGLGVSPFSEHPAYLAISGFAVAIIVANIVGHVAKARHAGMRVMPAFTAMVFAIFAVDALAFGWGFIASLIIYIVGQVFAYLMNLSQPVQQPAIYAMPAPKNDARAKLH